MLYTTQSKTFATPFQILFSRHFCNTVKNCIFANAKIAITIKNKKYEHQNEQSE